MKTEDTLDTKKKVYTTPELVEHGNLMELTQGDNPGIEDGDYGMGSSGIEKSPFIVMP